MATVTNFSGNKYF